ncbi:MAG: GntR family transcriptional regulator [Planctomycetota bacterium]|nr:MAG: GntR family transcriptional regulator [Planctomycetota bacterium]
MSTRWSNIGMSSPEDTKQKDRLFDGITPDGPKRDLAYQQLRRMLFLQQISPGSRLTESEWARRLGVNRWALREALVRLQVEGLVELGPKTGYFVPKMTIEDEREILLVRFSLESTAIELVCEAGTNTPEDLKQMQEALDMHERMIDDNYHLSAVEADWRFHQSLIDAADNRRLAAAYHNAPLLMLYPHVTRVTVWTWRSRKTIEEHSAILKAILAGEVSQAKELLRAHLFGYWQEDRAEWKKPGDAKAAEGAI